jgi:Ca2+-transporting ATPase
LNIVTDTFPALALAMEPGDIDVMRRAPHRPDEAILSFGFLRQISLYGVVIAAVTLGAFLWALEESPARATTMSFMTLALAQIFHLSTARGTNAWTNRYAAGAVALSVGLQLIAVYVPPLARVLRVVPPRLDEWMVIIGLAAIPVLVGQAARWRARLTHRDHSEQ